MLNMANPSKLHLLAKVFLNSRQERQILKQGQQELFNTILSREHPRNSILAHTRYGKSMVIAEAVLIRAVLFPEPWVFIGPTKTQAEILMHHLVQHLFDHSQFYSQLEVDIPLERLKRERSKDRLTFRRGGSVTVLTADAKNSRQIGQLLGKGGANIILDEAPLIPDRIEAMVIRMLADSANNYLVKIGNAFENNHFQRSFDDPKYHKMVIDCRRGIEESRSLPYDEGRLTQEMVDEARDRPFFEQLWECKFPDRSKADDRGYIPIVTREELLAAFERAKAAKPQGVPVIGDDVGAGGDFNVFYARWPTYAKKLERNRSADTMPQVGRAEHYRDQYRSKEKDPWFVVDKIGVGQGVVDRAKEKGLHVVGFVAGADAGKGNSDKYANLKTRCYWEAAQWVKRNAIEYDKELLEQLPEIRYTNDSEKRVKIEPKDDYKRRMGFSPDDAEAFMMTFAPIQLPPDIMFI